MYIVVMYINLLSTKCNYVTYNHTIIETECRSGVFICVAFKLK